MPVFPSKTASLRKRNQWFCQAIPMESLNEINGIVGQNQWNRFLKTAVFIRKTAVFFEKNCQFFVVILPVLQS
jgi:hypothetical protein